MSLPAIPNVERMTVDGAVQKQEFQSLGKQICAQGESQSKLRTALVALVALPLIPLIALFDLIRYGLFQYGKCDGKGWSLAQAHAAIATLSAKVKKLTGTNEIDPNAQSQAAMRRHVQNILDGYRAFNSHFLSNRNFDSTSARNGESQIADNQTNLIQEILAYLERNVTASKDFGSQLASIQEHVRQLFVEEGKGDFYIVNKVERTGPSPRLSDWALGEWQVILDGTNSFVDLFLTKVDQEYAAAREAAPTTAGANLVANLQSGVEQEVIIAEKAKEKMQQHAPDIYVRAIATDGPKNAPKIVKAFLQEGVAKGLLSKEEAQHIDSGIAPTPTQLATAVVENVMQDRRIHPTAKLAVAYAQIATAARELKQQRKLLSQDEVTFIQVANDTLQAAQNALDEEARVVLQQKQEAEAAAALIVQQEAEAAAAAQKIAAEQQNALTALKNFLHQIESVQQTLLAEHARYKDQAAQKAEVTNQLQQSLSQKVTVGSSRKAMTVFDAVRYRCEQITAISASKKTPGEQSTQLAQFEHDFGGDAIAMITALRKLEEKLSQVTNEMSQTLKKIEELDLEVATQIASFRQCALDEKQKLDDASRKEVEGLEKGVFHTQTQTNDTSRKLHHTGPFEKLPADSVEPRKVDWQDYLRGKPTSTISALWNGLRQRVVGG